ncbi:O-antigen ligase family protein [Winogradskyella aurantiaca]|uniref:O-antigen ligase family protein n=1 Tax=Winogradskyella aurantiaca TaxID=2219558 RepID=UPI000E1CCD8D|nr:O-antigen ligase family protein [Winogradskyella aurantiaca]
MSRNKTPVWRREFNYISLVVMHIIIGVVIFSIEPLRNPFYLAVIVFFFYKIITAANKKKQFWVLAACAYIIAGETLFRMTGGGLFYEISKYLVILFCLFGMFYDGISGKGYPYFIYLIALVPAVVIASMNLSFDLKFRSSVAFVLSGPVSLGIAALYCYNKKMSSSQMLDLLKIMSLPIISMTTYLYLYTPSIQDVVRGTDSNFATSGGYGPNQVSTLLGLGVFAFTVRLFLRSPSLGLKLINGFLLAFTAYRGIVTFSRGGVLAAIITISAFLFVLYWQSGYRRKQQILGSFVLLIMVGIGTWFYSKSQTNDLIEKRYVGQDAAGREKDISTGRLELFMQELEGFQNNPFFGVGASGMKNLRYEEEGQIVASHNEISRIFSEHGVLGIFILCILLFKPLSLRKKGNKNIFFYAFLAFWFATINHSAMRLAAPGFIYALALIYVTNDKKRPVRRQLPKRA